MSTEVAVSAIPPGAASSTSTFESSDGCTCGRQAFDPHFANRIKSTAARCRECKIFLFLREGFEVDKYCYRTSLMGRRRQMFALSQDSETLQFWPKRLSKSWATTVRIKDLRGIVFGAYTCTFKRQSASKVPPHWSAFSLVGKTRTYDFSCSSPEVVECCVRGLQQVMWVSQTSSPQRSISEPWPMGFYLWMRLRFRLQEEAHKLALTPNHQLWIVFMRSALKSSNELTKSRFIYMADRLKDLCQLNADRIGEMKELDKKFQFQKERVLDIAEDRYVCKIEATLPRTPSVIGREASTPRRPSASAPSVVASTASWAHASAAGGDSAP